MATSAIFTISWINATRFYTQWINICDFVAPPWHTYAWVGTDEHHVHLIVYHLIWCPKRRRKVLVGQVGKRCEELIRQKCDEKGWTILELAIQPDHVHLFVRVWPAVSAAEVVKECKGLSAFRLRQEFPDLLKLPSLWTRSYFASTAGNVSGETIQRYIAAQSTT